jgi:hypothetical protein
VPSRAAAPRTWLRALLWLWLGALIGAMGLFGAMTRVAFEVVPEPAVAGDLVRRLLGPLLAIGAISGVGLAGLGAALGRGRLAIAVALLLSITCIVNQFGVSRAVAEIHLTDPGLAPGMAARFATLHQLSVWLFVASGLIALVLAAIHAWIETGSARGIARGEIKTL